MWYTAVLCRAVLGTCPVQAAAPPARSREHCKGYTAHAAYHAVSTLPQSASHTHHSLVPVHHIYVRRKFKCLQLLHTLLPSYPVDPADHILSPSSLFLTSLPSLLLPL